MGNNIHNIFMLQNEIQNDLLKIKADFNLSYYELLLIIQGAEKEISSMAMKQTFYDEYRHLKAMASKGEVPSVNTSELEDK